MISTPSNRRSLSQRSRIPTGCLDKTRSKIETHRSQERDKPRTRSHRRKQQQEDPKPQTTDNIIAPGSSRGLLLGNMLFGRPTPPQLGQPPSTEHPRTTSQPRQVPLVLPACNSSNGESRPGAYPGSFIYSTELLAVGNTTTAALERKVFESPTVVHNRDDGKSQSASTPHGCPISPRSYFIPLPTPILLDSPPMMSDGRFFGSRVVRSQSTG